MKPTQESSAQEVLAGLVERVTFHNGENGFSVLRAKARGHRDLVTIVGHAATPAAVMLGDDRNKAFLNAKALRWCTCRQAHYQHLRLTERYRQSRTASRYLRGGASHRHIHSRDG
jgi:hypothetical protein